MKGYGGKWVNQRRNPREKTMCMGKKVVGVAWSRRWAAEKMHQVAGKMKWADVLMVWGLLRVEAGVVVVVVVVKMAEVVIVGLREELDQEAEGSGWTC
ncbi:hypothetical protein E2C01_038015 [Portunus trituberculatus]|uniref:Uncharacterized protein n=1 Tax=Portunus trituberculatus TaxID=210409 RepID=A0A5B7FD17_PORTR|nr:hypothetical protein [Portunus trituberculatus]